MVTVDPLTNFDLEPGELFSLTKRLTVVVLFCQYPLPELVVIHQQQQSLEDVLSLESYIKQVWPPPYYAVVCLKMCGF